MNQLNPGYHLAKNKILKKPCFYSAKIISMRKYHNAPTLVNTLCKNFTILLFSLYHAKAIKQESENDQNP
jgi:hypothetical protein